MRNSFGQFFVTLVNSFLLTSGKATSILVAFVHCEPAFVRQLIFLKEIPMDPTATWDQMLDAFGEEDWKATIELSDALLGWLKRGGFPPVVSVGSSVGDCFMVVQDKQAQRATAATVTRALRAHAERCLR